MAKIIKKVKVGKNQPINISAPNNNALKAKADRIYQPVVGNMVVQDKYGNVVDAGFSAVELQETLEDLSDKDTDLQDQIDTLTNSLATTDAKASSAYHFKGTKASVSALPSSGNQVGDVWNVGSDLNGGNYAWTGSAWDKLGDTVDLSGYYTKTECDNKFETKSHASTTYATKTELQNAAGSDDAAFKGVSVTQSSGTTTLTFTKGDGTTATASFTDNNTPSDYNDVVHTSGTASISHIVVDGTTIKVDDNTHKLYASLAGSLTYEQIADFFLTGGGLVVSTTTDSSDPTYHKVYFDPNSMSTDKFNELLIALNLPKYITADSGTTKHFYVNGNSGSDTYNGDDVGSSSHPFKTIHKCVEYIGARCNIHALTVYVNIATEYDDNGTITPIEYWCNSGTNYTSNKILKLPGYTRTTGYVILRPDTNATTYKKVILKGMDVIGTSYRLIDHIGGVWYLRNFAMTVGLSPSYDTDTVYSGIISGGANSELVLQNCDYYVRRSSKYTRTVNGNTVNIAGNGSCVFRLFTGQAATYTLTTAPSTIENKKYEISNTIFNKPYIKINDYNETRNLNSDEMKTLLISKKRRAISTDYFYNLYNQKSILDINLSIDMDNNPVTTNNLIEEISKGVSITVNYLEDKTLVVERQSGQIPIRYSTDNSSFSAENSSRAAFYTLVKGNFTSFYTLLVGTGYRKHGEGTNSLTFPVLKGDNYNILYNRRVACTTTTIVLDDENSIPEGTYFLFYRETNNDPYELYKFLVPTTINATTPEGMQKVAVWTNTENTVYDSVAKTNITYAYSYLGIYNLVTNKNTYNSNNYWVSTTEPVYNNFNATEIVGSVSGSTYTVNGTDYTINGTSVKLNDNKLVINISNDPNNGTYTIDGTDIHNSTYTVRRFFTPITGTQYTKLLNFYYIPITNSNKNTDFSVIDNFFGISGKKYNLNSGSFFLTNGAIDVIPGTTAGTAESESYSYIA